MRACLLLLVMASIHACSLDQGVAGSADVMGRVIQSSGLPLANSSVTVVCGPDATQVTVPIDTAGRYFLNLSAPTPGRIRCLFGVPDFVAARIRVDTVVGFAPNGQLHPLQILDLRESPTP